MLINKGSFSETEEYQAIRQNLYDAIQRVVWPTGSNLFSIRPEIQGNGVRPIKDAFILFLTQKGWEKEHKVDVGVNLKTPGQIDATKAVEDKYFAVEWETGNISSSHRALNKIVVGLLSGKLMGGSLVVPTRKLYLYLTDRVGNYEELEPYFPVWRSVTINAGFLSVIAVEHDLTDQNVELISKGTDGRALV